MADVNSNQVNGVNGNRSFLCGVVEGFYGRPWTPEQRKDLFSKQEKWGMNCYLYAPKDDYKHRAYWRELYTVEEAEHLQALITEAWRHNITFYYAISPGLDIAYSSQKEVAALKRKLEQVQQLGCCAFALLFDDIDPEMSGPDKEVYQSFAHAQVSISNEVFAHLNQPHFMFCPTQYCSTRAVPSVQTSEYLNTLGAKLAPEIDIMWTGPKVISKIFTVEHIREVSSVLRRAPVIWDNLHANDYDQARLFLGPFCGRSPSLIPLLRGVVSNPNCEYGPNFIAIHTLAQWSLSAMEETCGDGSELKDDAVSADIRLETEGDDLSASSYCPSGLPPSTYHPRRALRLALQDWLEEFRKSVLAQGPIQQPQVPLPIPIVPSVNTCMSLTSTTPVPATLPTIVSNVQQVAEVIQDSNFVPTTPVVMNSLVSENKIDTVLPEQLPEVGSGSSLVSQDAGSTASSAEPMDCNQSPIPSPTLETLTPTASTVTPIADPSSTEPEEDPMVVEPSRTEATSDDAQFSSDDGSPPQAADVDSPNSLSLSATDADGVSHDNTPINPDLQLTLEDLYLLADLFYLPFEHGKKGIIIMTEFNWLKSNAHLVIEHNRNNPDGTRKPEVQEWFDKAEKFDAMSKDVQKMSERLFHVRNRSLLYELYPYVWDMRGVVSLLNSYVRWLALGQVSTLVSSYVHGNYTWFSKGWREAFMSGDQEPWIFRGGLTAELQRLIPVDGSNDLFSYKAPDNLVSGVYVIRPYQSEDKEALYRLVLRMADDGRDGEEVYGQHPNLPGDVTVGSYLSCPGSVVMLVEDDAGTLAGYCCAATSARAHYHSRLEHITAIREQYPKVVREEGAMLTACEQLLASLWDPPLPFPVNTPTSTPMPPTATNQDITMPCITTTMLTATEHLTTTTTTTASVSATTDSSSSSTLLAPPITSATVADTSSDSSIAKNPLITNPNPQITNPTTLVAPSNPLLPSPLLSTPLLPNPLLPTPLLPAPLLPTPLLPTPLLPTPLLPAPLLPTPLLPAPLLPTPLLPNPLLPTPLLSNSLLPTPLLPNSLIQNPLYIVPDTSASNGSVLPVAPAPPPTPVGDMLRYYPATLRLAVQSSVLDESIAKRLLTCVLASLRAKGGFGGYVSLPNMDKNNMEQYAKLGFSKIGSIGDTVYLTRSF